MTKLELELVDALRTENSRLAVQNERLREAVDGIAQNPEYVQAAGWWGRFAASLAGDKRKLQDRIAELEARLENFEERP